jgi:hypothetical protein
MTVDTTPEFPALVNDGDAEPPQAAGSSQATEGPIEEQWEMGFMEEVTNPVRPEVSVSMLEAETAVLPEEDAATEEPPPAPVGEAQVKLELFGRPDEDLAQMTRHHLQKMEANPHFTAPMPTQAELNGLLETFVQDCRDTRNAMTHVRLLVAQKQKSRRRLEQALNRRGNYVQLTSRGDAEAILSTAFGIRRKRQAVAELEAPTDVQATPGPVAGSMILTWTKVKHAKLYRLEYGPADGPVVEVPLTGRRRKELHGLEVGRLHRFRIAAIGGATGQSPWSVVVERMVA